jgi:hypothetical protein
MRVRHFPLRPDIGPDQLLSVVTEDTDVEEREAETAPRLCLALGDSVIISLVWRTLPAVAPGAAPRGVLRLILRDKTGRYVWDVERVAERPPIVIAPSARPPPLILPPSGVASAAAAPPTAAGGDAASQRPAERDEAPSNVLSAVRRFVQSEVDAAQAVGMIPPTAVSGEVMKKELEAVTLKIYSHMHQEASLHQRRQAALRELRNYMVAEAAKSGNNSSGASVTDAKEAESSALALFDAARPLLAQIFFGPDLSDAELERRTFPTPRVLEDGDRLRRSVRLLDNEPARECHKIGVVYVMLGQDDQREILRNEAKDASLRYLRFLGALGWEVDVASHRGFLAGLDARSTGATSVYWASSTTELMLHVVTSMPTLDSDPQQIHKKRQVGNDHVHLVYSEHDRDYLPSTISSQFNDAHICLYPLPDGLYRVQIFAKETVPHFGPLSDGMVVPEECVGELARATAVNANRARRFATPGFGRPYPTRQKYIADIITRNVVPRNAAELQGALFPPTARPTTSAAAQVGSAASSVAAAAGAAAASPSPAPAASPLAGSAAAQPSRPPSAGTAPKA